MQHHWTRLGRIPSAVAFLTLYGIELAAAVLLHDPADLIVAIALLAVYLAYCLARPHHRLAVFVSAFVPTATGTLLHDIFGISSLWGLLTIPLVLLALRDIDREPVAADDAAASPGQT